jgi:Uma2 family endonuclease
VHYPREEYLRTLDMSTIELEYCDGEIHAMAGAAPEHADLAGAMTGLLQDELPGRCGVSSADLKVRTEATDLSTFPSVTAACGARRMEALDANAVIHPTTPVEATRRSTESYDRGAKLRQCKQIPRLGPALIVSHRRPEGTAVAREDPHWVETEHRSGEVVTLRDPERRLSVDELYDGVVLEPRRTAA